ncbi:putative Long-chain-alcohol oxidase FAO2 [Glarea lozoyensis 74030]|uniref:Long-chain-alcohol oxidase n=1 Tax=Glarea lozoyensis (strain ATCC 74030 / MF5533) TaxID=1104152 RepID=H0EHX4_GLAL7|nr:putative Long-chain-alcohol oxidase FAO2 [Glarea lozoyensis 74030]
MAAAEGPPLPIEVTDENVANPFSDTQWTTLMSIMDTIIPSIQNDSSTDQNAHKSFSAEEFNTAVNSLRDILEKEHDIKIYEEYLNRKASDESKFQNTLKHAFGKLLPESARKGMAFILSTLDTRVGSMLLTGYTTSFHDQPIHIREAILESWRVSYLPTLNLVYKQMMVIAKNVWLNTSPSFRELVGIPGGPDHVKLEKPFENDFLQFNSGTAPEIVETDVVIVGSGCGGGVCAKNIAEAGHRVLVVDKAYHIPAAQLPLSEQNGLRKLFEGGAMLTSDDGSIAVAAGSAWGGGGTINWSASLQPQEFVRREWSQDKGLEVFESAEFQDCLDTVCKHMEGSRKLGFSAKAVPQNTGGKEHYCGHCTLGCGSSEKQGPAVAWLPDAVRAGAQMVEGFRVDHVIFDEDDPTKATGVKGLWTARDDTGEFDSEGRTTREVIVKAKKVIISSGTLWSPIILQNSGLRNYHIGRNLHLHPVNMLSAIFPTSTRPWEGGILTSVCTTFENLDGLGHGAKLETTVMLPSMFLVGFPWYSGLQFKRNALKFRNMNGFISIARDRDTGRVYPDPTTGTPRVKYTPSVFDRKHILEGVIGLAKIAYIQGAVEIHPFTSAGRPFIRDPNANPGAGITDPHFQNWIKEFREGGNKPPATSFSSAHQMGTCRMSRTEAEGVVDDKGRVWGCKGLYVADASVFPSASGVNPMVTNMAVAEWISRGVVGEMGKVEV